MPAAIARAGERAAKRFLKFFAATIRNPNTREAYYRASCRFLARCEQNGITDLDMIEPLHVAPYVEAMCRDFSKPTVKQNLAGRLQGAPKHCPRVVCIRLAMVAIALHRCTERPRAILVMAGSVNKVILIGNLGADPEIRHTQDGRPIANLRIATSESWRDKTTGEREERTDWHRVVIFNENLCKVAEQYLKKGSKVFIEGQLQTRKWQDQSGQDRYSTEVVLQGFRGELTLLDRAGGGSGVGDLASDDAGGEAGSSAPAPKAASAGAARRSSADMDDEIPF